MADKPQYKRGAADSSQLPYGGATQVNKASASAPSQPATPPLPQAPVAPEIPAPPQNSDIPMSGDISGVDEVMFGPTHRPDEPLTTGLPFGEGANHTRLPNEDDKSFMQRVGAELAASPYATSRVKNYAVRQMRGQ